MKAFIDKTLKEDKITRTSDSYEKEGVFTGKYCINPLTGFLDAHLCGQLRAV